MGGGVAIAGFMPLSEPLVSCYPPLWTPLPTAPGGGGDGEGEGTRRQVKSLDFNGKEPNLQPAGMSYRKPGSKRFAWLRPTSRKDLGGGVMLSDTSLFRFDPWQNGKDNSRHKPWVARMLLFCHRGTNRSNQKDTLVG